MPASFPRTLRFLAAERSSQNLWFFGVVGITLLAWVIWMLVADIAIVESSREARVELREAVHPIVSPLAGRIIATRLVLGAEVQEGEVVVELDSERESALLEREQRKLEALAPQLEALHRQVAAREQMLDTARTAARAAIGAAQARGNQAQSSARLAAEEVRRLELGAEILPELELVRARAERERAEALVRELGSETQELAARHESADSLGRFEIEQLRREITAIEGQESMLRASIRVLEEDLERRRIRATASGRVGEVTRLQVGHVLEAGERVGTIVRDGPLELVAWFPVARSFGRIKEGQRARMRLDAFPWTEFGTVSARVATVAREHRDALVAVELEVLSPESLDIPLQHGLTGTVEVDVETITPAHMLIRALGRL